MSVLISGVLTDGAGLPMSGYHIILKARQNTSAVVMRTVATVVTGPAGEYAFEAQTGIYDVYLRSCIEREYCVGDIWVYDDSRPGTLNDFLTALDEGDLKPDVVKRFEEMLAQAQQSAEAAAESERQSGQHAADAQKIKDDCQMLADNVQQNAEAVAEDKQRVEHLASEVELNAGQVQQSITDAVKQAQQVADDAASSAEESKNNAQEAKQYRDEAQQIIDSLNATNATTMDKGLVQLCSDTDNDTEELAATPKAVKAVMDEVKGKAPLDSPAFTGMPTTPTPSQDASGCEIVNAEFVRALIAATSSGSYSTDSVVPLVINGAQLQSAHQSNGPLVINKVQFQHVRQTRTNAPLVVNKAQIQSAHQSSGPLVINKAQLQHGRQARTNGPLVVNRMGLSFAFVTPLQ